VRWKTSPRGAEIGYFHFLVILRKDIVTMNVEEEVQRLSQEIKRLGQVQEDGSYKVYITKSHLSIFFHIMLL